MSGMFLDTGYLIALVNKRDNLHNSAIAASQEFYGPFFTTELILVELANSLCLSSQRQLAVRIIEKIQADPLTTIIPFPAEKFKETFAFYKRRPDKSWGMIDCFSFLVMDEFGIKQALTFDEHFRQAGYKTPLL
ncbi:MAG: hypothetical protein A2077_00525 [Nitrospirae bacterium GWC2_46_6]|nr:MAG: hypothetical protein A2077_00525 [Nitrospirae bacterium GWC2_46_6]OGW24204.1 MAG: hypothetical protein A2X55_04570 [Nitrospirae bacterium GWB2_47_37]HAK89685.1 hypothetical protein [Nitrospiraceae bacterium]HCL80920.1 hypothetical protein [Nitrospiraceae bacterium]HCZ10681.1 hypothetical protein [Nitrospiraceae bacterium]